MSLNGSCGPQWGLMGYGVSLGLWGHFGVSMGFLWGYAVILGSLWGYGVSMGL